MANRIMKVIDENGNEKQMQILFTTSLEQFKKNYVFYIDSEAENKQVYVSQYNDNGHLENITDENEWAELEKVFNQFIEDSKNSCSNCNGSCSDCNHDDCDDSGNCDCKNK